MSRRVLLGALAIAAVGAGLIGCTKPVVREKPLADPLLVSKKPVEGKQHLANSRSPGDDIPQPPPPPPKAQLLPPRVAGR